MNSISLKTGGGLSAYEVAVKNGFKGTEAEWLQSIKQPALDAADVAINAANNANDKALLAQNAANNANDVVDIIELTNQKIIDEEEKRKTQETNRVNKEIERVTTEENRVSTESLRVASEIERIETETTRISNEQARTTAETSRVEVESARVVAEEGRISAETLRVEKDIIRDVKLAELAAKIELLESVMISKFGIVYFDYPNSRYLAFANSESKDIYLSNPDINGKLILGKWGGSEKLITLNIKDKLNNPAPKVEVIINGDTLITDSNGVINTYLLTGTYSIGFKYKSIDIANQDITIQNNQTIEIIIPEIEILPTTIFTTKSIQPGIRFSTAQEDTIIDWGDGTVTNPVVTGAEWNNHIYEDGKEDHTITIEGTYNLYFYGSINTSSQYAAFKGMYKLVQLAGNNTSYNGTFSRCNITEIAPNAFKFSKVTNMLSCFSGSTNLTSIPDGLFDNNPNIVNFSSTFSGCTGLTTIPTGLFDKQINNVRFDECFSGCTQLISTPEGLFDKNVKVVDFRGCFRNCSNLNQIYNLTLSSNPKLWERDGTNGGSLVKTFAGFADGAHTTFRNTIPIDWDGTMSI